MHKPQIRARSTSPEVEQSRSLLTKHQRRLLAARHALLAVLNLDVPVGSGGLHMSATWPSNTHCANHGSIPRLQETNVQLIANGSERSEVHSNVSSVAHVSSERSTDVTRRPGIGGRPRTNANLVCGRSVASRSVRRRLGTGGRRCEACASRLSNADLQKVQSRSVSPLQIQPGCRKLSPSASPVCSLTCGSAAAYLQQGRQAHLAPESLLPGSSCVDVAIRVRASQLHAEGDDTSLDFNAPSVMVKCGEDSSCRLDISPAYSHSLLKSGSDEPEVQMVVNSSVGTDDGIAFLSRRQFGNRNLRAWQYPDLAHETGSSSGSKTDRLRATGHSCGLAPATSSQDSQAMVPDDLSPLMAKHVVQDMACGSNAKSHTVASAGTGDYSSTGFRLSCASLRSPAEDDSLTTGAADSTGGSCTVRHLSFAAPEHSSELGSASPVQPQYFELSEAGASEDTFDSNHGCSTPLPTPLIGLTSLVIRDGSWAPHAVHSQDNQQAGCKETHSKMLATSPVADVSLTSVDREAGVKANSDCWSWSSKLAAATDAKSSNVPDVAKHFRDGWCTSPKPVAPMDGKLFEISDAARNSVRGWCTSSKPNFSLEGKLANISADARRPSLNRTSLLLGGTCASGSVLAKGAISRRSQRRRSGPFASDAGSKGHVHLNKEIVMLARAAMAADEAEAHQKECSRQSRPNNPFKGNMSAASIGARAFDASLVVDLEPTMPRSGGRCAGNGDEVSAAFFATLKERLHANSTGSASRSSMAADTSAASVWFPSSSLPVHTVKSGTGEDDCSGSKAAPSYLGAPGPCIKASTQAAESSPSIDDGLTFHAASNGGSASVTGGILPIAGYKEASHIDNGSQVCRRDFPLERLHNSMGAASSSSTTAATLARPAWLPGSPLPVHSVNSTPGEDDCRGSRAMASYFGAPSPCINTSSQAVQPLPNNEGASFNGASTRESASTTGGLCDWLENSHAQALEILSSHVTAKNLGVSCTSSVSSSSVNATAFYEAHGTTKLEYEAGEPSMSNHVLACASTDQAASCLSRTALELSPKSDASQTSRAMERQSRAPEPLMAPSEISSAIYVRADQNNTSDFDKRQYNGAASGQHNELVAFSRTSNFTGGAHPNRSGDVSMCFGEQGTTNKLEHGARKPSTSDPAGGCASGGRVVSGPFKSALEDSPKCEASQAIRATESQSRTAEPLMAPPETCLTEYGRVDQNIESAPSEFDTSQYNGAANSQPNEPAEFICTGNRQMKKRPQTDNMGGASNSSTAVASFARPDRLPGSSLPEFSVKSSTRRDDCHASSAMPSYGAALGRGMTGSTQSVTSSLSNNGEVNMQRSSATGRICDSFENRHLRSAVTLNNVGVSSTCSVSSSSVNVTVSSKTHGTIKPEHVVQEPSTPNLLHSCAGGDQVASCPSKTALELLTKSEASRACRATESKSKVPEPLMTLPEETNAEYARADQSMEFAPSEFEKRESNGVANSQRNEIVASSRTSNVSRGARSNQSGDVALCFAEQGTTGVKGEDEDTFNRAANVRRVSRSDKTDHTRAGASSSFIRLSDSSLEYTFGRVDCNHGSPDAQNGQTSEHIWSAKQAEEDRVRSPTFEAPSASPKRRVISQHDGDRTAAVGNMSSASSSPQALDTGQCSVPAAGNGDEASCVDHFLQIGRQDPPQERLHTNSMGSVGSSSTTAATDARLAWLPGLSLPVPSVNSTTGEDDCHGSRAVPSHFGTLASTQAAESSLSNHDEETLSAASTASAMSGTCDWLVNSHAQALEIRPSDVTENNIGVNGTGSVSSGGVKAIFPTETHENIKLQNDAREPSTSNPARGFTSGDQIARCPSKTALEESSESEASTGSRATEIQSRKPEPLMAPPETSIAEYVRGDQNFVLAPSELDEFQSNGAANSQCNEFVAISRTSNVSSGAHSNQTGDVAMCFGEQGVTSKLEHIAREPSTSNPARVFTSGDQVVRCPAKTALEESPESGASTGSRATEIQSRKPEPLMAPPETSIAEYVRGDQNFELAPSELDEFQSNGAANSQCNEFVAISRTSNVSSGAHSNQTGDVAMCFGEQGMTSKLEHIAREPTTSNPARGFTSGDQVALCPSKTALEESPKSEASRASRDTEIQSRKPEPLIAPPETSIAEYVRGDQNFVLAPSELDEFQSNGAANSQCNEFVAFSHTSSVSSGAHSNQTGDVAMCFGEQGSTSCGGADEDGFARATHVRRASRAENTNDTFAGASPSLISDSSLEYTFGAVDWHQGYKDAQNGYISECIWNSEHAEDYPIRCPTFEALCASPHRRIMSERDGKHTATASNMSSVSSGPRSIQALDPVQYSVTPIGNGHEASRTDYVSQSSRLETLQARPHTNGMGSTSSSSTAAATSARLVWLQASSLPVHAVKSNTGVDDHRSSSAMPSYFIASGPRMKGSTQAVEISLSNNQEVIFNAASNIESASAMGGMCDWLEHSHTLAAEIRPSDITANDIGVSIAGIVSNSSVNANVSHETQSTTKLEHNAREPSTSEHVTALQELLKSEASPASKTTESQSGEPRSLMVSPGASVAEYVPVDQNMEFMPSEFDKRRSNGAANSQRDKLVEFSGTSNVSSRAHSNQTGDVAMPFAEQGTTSCGGANEASSSLMRLSDRSLEHSGVAAGCHQGSKDAQSGQILERIWSFEPTEDRSRSPTFEAPSASPNRCITSERDGKYPAGAGNISSASSSPRSIQALDLSNLSVCPHALQQTPLSVRSAMLTDNVSSAALDSGCMHFGDMSDCGEASQSMGSRRKKQWILEQLVETGALQNLAAANGIRGGAASRTGSQWPQSSDADGSAVNRSIPTRRSSRQMGDPPLSPCAESEGEQEEKPIEHGAAHDLLEESVFFPAPSTPALLLGDQLNAATTRTATCGARHGQSEIGQQKSTGHQAAAGGRSNTKSRSPHSGLCPPLPKGRRAAGTNTHLDAGDGRQLLPKGSKHGDSTAFLMHSSLSYGVDDRVGRAVSPVKSHHDQHRVIERPQRSPRARSDDSGNSENVASPRRGSIDGWPRTPEWGSTANHFGFPIAPAVLPGHRKAITCITSGAPTPGASGDHLVSDSNLTLMEFHRPTRLNLEGTQDAANDNRASVRLRCVSSGASSSSPPSSLRDPSPKSLEGDSQTSCEHIHQQGNLQTSRERISQQAVSLIQPSTVPIVPNLHLGSVLANNALEIQEPALLRGSSLQPAANPAHFVLFKASGAEHPESSCSVEKSKAGPPTRQEEIQEKVVIPKVGPQVAKSPSKAAQPESPPQKKEEENKEKKDDSPKTCADSPVKGKGKGDSPKRGKGKGAAPPPKKGGAMGKGKASPLKPDVVPTVPLKKLFWTPINLAGASSGAQQNSIWEKIHKAGANFDKCELEALFAEAPSATAANKLNDSSGQQENHKPRAKRRRLLDEQRRRQVWFMLALLPERSSLPAAIMKMDGAVLETDKVELLHSNLPTTAEETMMRAAMRDVVLDENEEWDVPEAFIGMLITISEYALRVQVWVFLNAFQNTFLSMTAVQEDVQSACDTLKKSACVEKLLALILFVGNYLNGGTPRGRADGFDIDTLTKLGKLKASNKEFEGTLLDFIIKQMENDNASMLAKMFAPGGEFHIVNCARKHNLSDNTDELAGLIRKAEEYLQKLEMHAGTDESLAHCKEQLLDRLTQLRSLMEGFVALDKRYVELCAWFRMDTDRLKPAHEFFNLWNSFLVDVKKALDMFEKKQRASRTPPRPGRRSSQSPAKPCSSSPVRGTPRRSLSSLRQASPSPECDKPTTCSVASRDGTTSMNSTAETVVAQGDGSRNECNESKEPVELCGG